MDVVTCPNCGQVQVRDESGKCIKCGTFISAIQKENKEPQKQVDAGRIEAGAAGNVATKAKKKGKKLPIVITLISLLVVVAVCATLFVKIQRKKEYIDALYTLRASVLLGGSEAEDLGNLTRSVWYDAIFKEYDSETKPYVLNEHGGYVTNFNEAIRNLSNDESIQTQKDIISGTLDVAEDAMSVLKSPPEDMRECYEVAFDLYTEFSNLCNLAINPSGSLQSYTEEFRETDGDVADLYERLNVIMPEKIVFPWESVQETE